MKPNKYPQEPPLRCLPGEWQYYFETYLESSSAAYQAMWAYFFEVADLLRERAERRAEELEEANLTLANNAARLVHSLCESIDRNDELTEEVFHLRRLLASEENTCEEAEAECRGLRFQHAQDVEVIRSLQEQLKEKDEEITALQHCVADEQATVARSKEAFLNMQQNFIHAQSTILELRKPQRYEQPCVYPYPMGHR